MRFRVRIMSANKMISFVTVKGLASLIMLQRHEQTFMIFYKNDFCRGKTHRFSDTAYFFRDTLFSEYVRIAFMVRRRLDGGIHWGALGGVTL